MITFFGAPIGEIIGDKSYFSSITYNGLQVDHVNANGVRVAEGGYIPELQELKDKGCTHIFDVYESHPQILDVIKGGAFMKFDGASAFVLDTIPAYTDAITTRFMLSVTDDKTKTLWASRDMSKSGKDSFSTFIIKTGVRSDFGDKTGPTNPYNFSLNANVFYEYVQKAGKTILNGTEKDNLVDAAVFSPSQQITLGASASSNMMAAFSNYLTNTWYNTFSVLKNDDTYRCFIVPFEDNKMVDLVSGIVYVNKGTGTAEFIESV